MFVRSHWAIYIHLSTNFRCSVAKYQDSFHHVSKVLGFCFIYCFKIIVAREENEFLAFVLLRSRKASAGLGNEEKSE